MASRQRIHPRTRVCAQVLGPYLLIAAATLVARPQYTKTLLHSFDSNSGWAWIAGAFVLPMGLVVVVLHPYWRGAAAAIVSVLGWLTVLKGIALMALPQTYLSMGQDVTAGPWWTASVAVMGVIGLYLTVVGWAPSRPSEQSS